jgi:hypothetical protein
MRKLIVCALLLVGCGSDPETETPTTENANPDRPAAKLGSDLAWPKDAPSPDACEQDEDCLVVPVGPDPNDPCCEVTLTAASLNRMYLEYAEALREKRCSAVKCPPLRLPGAKLAECGYQARCIDGTCGNACPASATR